MMKRITLSLILSGCLSFGFAQTASDLDVFAKENFTTLKKSLTPSQIQSISSPTLQKVASQIADKSYPLQERYKTYNSYLNPRVLAKQIKTSPYSQYENPTGIYFTEGEEAMVWVDKTKGQKLSLVVVNWDDEHFKQSKYPLKEGLNTFTVTNKGNSYIEYFTDNNKKENPIAIHILSGKVNGVFDLSKDNNKKYQAILANAQGPIVDLVGKKVHLAYSVNALKSNTPEKGVELMQLYDSIINIQHEIMGLVKYKREPKNHMFGRVIWKGFMHADGIGAAFHENTMKDVANIPNLRKNSWGVAHEFGHVNQVRPNMKWVGTTEVTNNIYSVWTQYLYNPTQPKLEREKLKDYDEPKIGGRITSYMESAFVNGEQWLTQAGPDRWQRERPRDWGGDHFVKLVPLWQLQLYFAEVGKNSKWGNKDFYGDIFIKAIDDTTVNAPQDSYYQLQFVKNACDVSKLDLTDFFEKSGILAPIDLLVDDYTVGQMTITADDVAELKKYAKRYPKPTTPVLHYLTANSINAFRNLQPVSGTKNTGFVKQEGKIVINNSNWPNAVAFETYKGDKLIKIAFVGAGSNDASETIVHIPNGFTAVKAVGADGSRIDVI